MDTTDAILMIGIGVLLILGIRNNMTIAELKQALVDEDVKIDALTELAGVIKTGVDNLKALIMAQGDVPQDVVDALNEVVSSTDALSSGLGAVDTTPPGS